MGNGARREAYAPPAPRNLFGGATQTAWPSGLEEPTVTPFRRTSAFALAMLSLAWIFVACAGVAASPSAIVGSSPSAPSPGADASPTTATELSAIGCATDDPEDVGELTGAWDADDGGVYYIRQVGDCVWWFGTDLVDINSGQTGQRGFSNVAAGHMNGREIEMEWADVPIGEILGGGGLTLLVDEAADNLVVTEQRGVWGFGGTRLTRIDANASPDASPSESATP